MSSPHRRSFPPCSASAYQRVCEGSYLGLIHGCSTELFPLRPNLFLPQKEASSQILKQNTACTIDDEFSQKIRWSLLLNDCKCGKQASAFWLGQGK